MRIRNIGVPILMVISASTAVAARAISKDVCRSVLECHVTGEDSPEATLRQVDEHALRSMFCSTGCDYAVNNAISHPYATKLASICSVEKDENEIKREKYSAKDSDKSRRLSQRFSGGNEVAKRDIDAYTVGSATVRFCCTSQDGTDYTEAVSIRILMLQYRREPQNHTSQKLMGSFSFVFYYLWLTGGEEDQPRVVDLQAIAVIDTQTIGDGSHCDIRELS